MAEQSLPACTGWTVVMIGWLCCVRGGVDGCLGIDSVPKGVRIMFRFLIDLYLELILS